MSPYLVRNPTAWQESWDRQQEAYLPDREQRIAAMLDTVAAVTATDGTAAPRLLDLAGGTGSISLRALRRFPDAEVTLVDLDPVLLAIAQASLTGRAVIVSANLDQPDWVATVPHRDYDAVLTATALHWLSAARVASLYGEIRGLLRPGGVFINADHMPDDGLPELTKHLMAAAETRRAAQYATGAARSWQDWWQDLEGEPELAPLLSQRKAIYPTGHSAEWAPPVTWHLDALRTAGYSEAGLIWRGGPDAAVAGIR